MKFSLGALCLLFSSVFTKGFSQDNSYRPLHIGFCYPLSTNGAAAPVLRNGFSLHALVGVSAAEDAFCASGIASIVQDSMKGVQASGLLGYVGGNLNSAQFSGLSGIVRAKAKGIQASGLNSYAASLEGCQFSGLLNVVKDSVSGLQGAGFANVAAKLDGVQTSGFINVADSVFGAQISGFLNIAHVVKGVQIAGFLNIADSCEYPIGLINIIGNGERWLGVQYDESGSALLTFRSGSKKLYGILSAGVNPTAQDFRYVLEGGMGMHAFQKGAFRLKTELTLSSVTRFDEGVFMRSALRLLPSVRFARSLELYGGISLGFVNTPMRSAFRPDLYYFWERNSRGTFYGINAGAVAGIQFHL